ncbi:unnamed protein product [Protopolystoma xenopodis]|uniref:Uncharacterized protein n=1 Tax=Protopolystoma xenopodis TaxID=117903 RepID=A0A448WE43_9PLAT|nr:unnamed protein product [Protopolystoma xenopodis]
MRLQPCLTPSGIKAQLIAHSIGNAFQMAYLQFLRANGIEDPADLHRMDYQDVLNQQEIFCDELNMFSNEERQKESEIQYDGRTYSLLETDGRFGDRNPGSWSIVPYCASQKTLGGDFSYYLI